MFGAVQVLNVLILTLLCVLLFNLVKLTELPPVLEKAASSTYHLCLFIFPFNVKVVIITNSGQRQKSA